MSASKRPSTSSLRRFITSRPYVPIAEIRRRFGLDDPDAMTRVACNGTSAYVGLPEREATKLQDLWERGELGLELSVEVRAPVVVGVYPMRIARYVIDQANGNGHVEEAPAAQPPENGAWSGNGHASEPIRQPVGDSAPSTPPSGHAGNQGRGERRRRRHWGRRPPPAQGQYAAE
jgi:hypothetical protein